MISYAATKAALTQMTKIVANGTFVVTIVSIKTQNALKHF